VSKNKAIAHTELIERNEIIKEIETIEKIFNLITKEYGGINAISAKKLLLHAIDVIDTRVLIVPLEDISNKILDIDKQ
jgi:hypothetical protein